MQANERLENSSISSVTDEILAMQANMRLENSSISALNKISALTDEIQAIQANERLEHASISTLIGFASVVAVVFMALNLVVLVS